MAKMDHHAVGKILAIVGLFAGMVTSDPQKTGDVISITPSNIFAGVALGKSYMVTCHGENPGTEVKWVNPKGKEISNHTGRVHVEKSNFPRPGSLSLVFEHVNKTDKGNWTCQTGDQLHAKYFTIIINEPLMFTDLNTMQTGTEGKKASILCTATGDPAPGIKWYHDGHPINYTDTRFERADNGLIIHNVSISDKGKYTCRATQVSPSTSDYIEAVIELKIEHKPIPVKQLPLKAKAQPAYGYISGIVNLTCEALAEPAATFVWYRKGKKVAKAGGKIFENSHLSVLQVELKDRSDLGDYVCEARNNLGDFKRVITLFEAYRPEPPVQVILQGANDNTLNFEIANPPPPDSTSTVTSSLVENLPVLGYDYISGYNFQYMKAPKVLDNIMVPKKDLLEISNDVSEMIRAENEPPMEIHPALWENATTVFLKMEQDGKYLLSGLEHDTLYAVRVMTVNDAGESSPTKHMYCETLKNETSALNGASILHPSAILISLILATSLTLMANALSRSNLEPQVKRKLALRDVETSSIYNLLKNSILPGRC